MLLYYCCYALIIINNNCTEAKEYDLTYISQSESQPAIYSWSAILFIIIHTYYPTLLYSLHDDCINTLTVCSTCDCFMFTIVLNNNNEFQFEMLN